VYLGNCIGEKNVGKFFLFLLSTLGLAVFVLVSTIIIFVQIINLESDWSYKHIISIVVIFYSGMSFLCTLVVSLMQVYFISKGITTNECMRNKYDSTIYGDSCPKNWKKSFNC